MIPSLFKKQYPDTNHTPPENACILLNVTDTKKKCERVLMILERRPGGKHVWGLPGGALDKGETAWDGALRELSEETNLKLDLKLWDRKREVKFTTGNTRVYMSSYAGNSHWKYKGDPKNKEIVRVEFPRADAVVKSLKTGCPLTCAGLTYPLRHCMYKGMVLK